MGEEEDDRDRNRNTEPAPGSGRGGSAGDGGNSGGDSSGSGGGSSGGRRLPPRRGWRRGNDRYERVKGAAPVSELIGSVIKRHNLVDVVRQHSVYIFWRDMVGRQISSKTSPDSLSRGVLRVWAKTSSWMHELQFFKAQMLEQINAWVGSPPLVSEIRFSLSSQREAVDPVDHLRQLRRSLWQRMRARKSPPPAVSDEVKNAIRAEASTVQDDEVRAEIERVRLLWGL
ncbi:MAG TPA: DUF721 domain-containing protein [Kofleriaceae bacterium]|nr:DUF721 domain-containing protein [Kofleriaceae bacterium]